MLALIVLVVIAVVVAAVYFGARMSASKNEKKVVVDAEKRKRNIEDREVLEKKKIEMQMHQEEAMAMAKNSPDMVARVVKNWLT